MTPSQQAAVALWIDTLHVDQCWYLSNKHCHTKLTIRIPLFWKKGGVNPGKNDQTNCAPDDAPHRTLGADRLSRCFVGSASNSNDSKYHRRTSVQDINGEFILCWKQWCSNHSPKKEICHGRALCAVANSLRVRKRRTINLAAATKIMKIMLPGPFTETLQMVALNKENSESDLSLR